MKVLILADGTSIHSRRILDWHLAQGCDVTFVDFHDPLPEGAPRYRYLPYPGLRGGSVLRKALGKRAAGRITAWASARGLRRIWSATAPDVVHLYQIDSRAYHCCLAGIRPIVLSSWGTDINQHFTGTVDPGQRRRTARALAAADLVIADADDVLQKCLRLAGRSVPTERLVLGIDTTLFQPGYQDEARAWRARAGIPPDAPLLFSIRALTPLYGHHHVLAAFAQALPQLPPATVLVFKAYNDHGEAAYKAQLRLQAEHLGVLDRVRWTAGVPFRELPGLYAAADLVVNYPSMDGFPVTFLEAAACERQVLTNRLPAYAGTFAEANFWLVEPGEIAALAAAMASALSQPASRAVRRAAREVVVREYDERVTVQRLMAAYGRVIAEFSGSSTAGEMLPPPAEAYR
jgi:glycosyltransferase involved in cell wall biosynthesis